MEDIPALAKHFLNKFSGQFNKPDIELARDAWAKIEQYPWPGNVRELQNCIMRAVLTADDEQVHASDIQLGEELPAPPIAAAHHEAKAGLAKPTPDAVDNTADHRADNTVMSFARRAPEADDVWQALRNAVVDQIETALWQPDSLPPLGRWLLEDVVLHAAQRVDGNTRRGAAMLGIPETTFRRQLEKARREAASAYRARSPAWSAMTLVLEDVLDEELAQGAKRLERCQTLLLEEVERAVAGDAKRGAVLMDISPPTYRRWLQVRLGDMDSTGEQPHMLPEVVRR